MQSIGDIVTVVAVLLFLWTFVPKPARVFVRAHAGALIASTAHVAADMLHLLWQALTPLAYRLVTGSVPADLAQVQREANRRRAAQQRAALDFGAYDDEQAEEPAAAGGSLPRPVEAGGARADAEKSGGAGGVEAQKDPVSAPITEEEIAQLGAAIRHKHTAAKSNKAECIKAGWGLTKSGSDPRYKRASYLFDLATQPQPTPEPYPTISADREAQAAERRQEVKTA